VTASPAAPPPTPRLARLATAEKLRFLDKLPRQLAAPRLATLDQRLGLSQAGNNEVLFAWLNLALGQRYSPRVPVASGFLGEMGRRNSCCRCSRRCGRR
jgi:hypothetical protein